ncbi:TerY-C metal binding domain-containing protein [Pseudomonas sp. R5(2019)]|uniref:TerY-C metal binding domain-containing protein n=1 Tax=Pseudomonas sp. R5(2019) TaxID=2697566 RepID=UPI002114A50C|nr:TerY-C metal binding domain-containing protein [Pseudomonas sp. R5(2019)]
MLEKARQELAAFNRKGVAIPRPASTHAGISTSGPSHGDRILYCSKVPQASAVLVLKLNEKGAEITDVIVRRKTSTAAPGAAQAVRHDLDIRELLMGNYQCCPHCDNTALLLCTRCGNLSCIAIQATTMTCPACRHRGGVINKDINLEFSRSRNGQQGQPPSDQKRLSNQAGRPALPHKPG